MIYAQHEKNYAARDISSGNRRLQGDIGPAGIVNIPYISA